MSRHNPNLKGGLPSIFYHLLTRTAQSSRPPDASNNDSAILSRPAKANEDGEDEDSASLLANDLALQRLLSESHLLAAQNGNPSTSTTPAAQKLFSGGRTRHATNDLRVRALGTKISSIYTQKNMPMNIRKGIKAAGIAREDKRRRIAKENGVILERKGNGHGADSVRKRKRRDLAVDLPSVGRMKGAELRLSERDVRSIEGTRPSGRGGKGKRGRR
jgi:hypothetical protein